MAQHQAFQQRQLPVKEVAAGGNHGDRQDLGPGPVEHGRQRHRIVVLAMHDQGAQMGIGRVTSGGGGAGGGGGGAAQRWAASPTSTRCSTRPWGQRAASAWLATDAPNEKPANAIRWLALWGATCPAPPSRSCNSPRPASCRPALAPTPRKLKRSAVQPHCTKARARVCTTLLSIVPPNSGWGCAMMATPRGASTPSRTASMAPAAPDSSRRSLREFMGLPPLSKTTGA